MSENAIIYDDCRPYYSSRGGSPADYVPLFDPAPDPNYGSTEWDCWMGLFDDRRSRGIVGDIFVRSSDQEVSTNCISVEVLENVPKGWIVWNDDVERTVSMYDGVIVYRPINFRRTVVRKYDITNTLWYTSNVEDTHIIVPDPLSGSNELIDCFVIEGDHTNKFNTTSIVGFYVLQSEENTGIYFIDRESNSEYDIIQDVTRIYTENRLPVKTVNKRHGRTSLTFNSTTYDINDITDWIFSDQSTRRCFAFNGDLRTVFVTEADEDVGFIATINNNYLSGNYIVDVAEFDPVQNRTLVSVKDYKGTTRDVELGSFSTGNITNLHTIEIYETHDTLYIPSELPVRTLTYTGIWDRLHDNYMNVDDGSPLTSTNFLKYYNGSSDCSLISLYSGDVENSGSPQPLPPYTLSGPTITYCDSREYTHYSNYLKFNTQFIPSFRSLPTTTTSEIVDTDITITINEIVAVGINDTVEIPVELSRDAMTSAIEDDITIVIHDSWDQLQTNVNGSSLLIEVPHTRSRFSKDYYFDIRRYFNDDLIKQTLIGDKETFLTGGNGFPFGVDNFESVIDYIRSGPERTMVKNRTGENQNGTDLILQTGTQEWNGSDWQEYIPNTGCMPQII